MTDLPDTIMCFECKDGTIMLKKHKDRDSMNEPIQWYRCKKGHWRAQPIKG